MYLILESQLFQNDGDLDAIGRLSRVEVDVRLFGHLVGKFAYGYVLRCVFGYCCYVYTEIVTVGHYINIKQV